MAFRHDGWLIASADDRHVKVWEVAGGRELGNWKTEGLSLLAFLSSILFSSIELYRQGHLRWP